MKKGQSSVSMPENKECSILPLSKKASYKKGPLDHVLKLKRMLPCGGRGEKHCKEKQHEPRHRDLIPLRGSPITHMAKMRVTVGEGRRQGV